MIKLIASDLDGTLLRNGAQSLELEVLEMIRSLQEQGIVFVAASGRQYPNLKRLFAPVWKDMIFICENGALTMYHDRPLASYPIPRELVGEIIRDVLALEHCDVQLNAQNTCYLMPRTRAYSDFMVYTLKNTVAIVDDIFAVQDDILKLSAYVEDNGAAEMGPYFIERWGHRVNTAVAGGEWVDFSLADKGMAIRMIQQKLGLKKDEMMAFGDNFNDEQMLQAVGRSYAMESAPEHIKQLCGHVCAKVEDVLQQFFQAKTDT